MFRYCLKLCGVILLCLSLGGCFGTTSSIATIEDDAIHPDLVLRMLPPEMKTAGSIETDDRRYIVKFLGDNRAGDIWIRMFAVEGGAAVVEVGPIHAMYITCMTYGYVKVVNGRAKLYFATAEFFDAPETLQFARAVARLDAYTQKVKAGGLPVLRPNSISDAARAYELLIAAGLPEFDLTKGKLQ